MEKIYSWVEIEVGTMAIKQGQVGYTVSLNQKYVAAWQALLWDLLHASKSVTEILAEAETTDAFKVLLAANDTYITANGVSTALTTTYFDQLSTGVYADEETARINIATNAPTHLTALITYIAAWRTVINCATNNSGDKEVFYNFTIQDRNLFLSAFQTIVDALDDAYSLFKALTDTTHKYTNTSLETVSKTNIPAAAAALSVVSQKMNRVAADINSAIIMCETTETVPLPGQANMAKANSLLGTITTATSGTIDLFSAANTLVFTNFNTDV